MAGMTLADAQANYDAALAAYQAAVSVQSYSIKDRSKTNHNITALREEMVFWSNQIAALAGGRTRSRTRYVVTE